MKKPENNEENLKHCICEQCSLFSGCNQEKAEKLFCARQKSACEMDSKKMCICGMCHVYNQYELSGGYFCINEIF
jgi:hypothetical protein